MKGIHEMNIKKNDTVIVLSGKSKGKKGKVLTALPAENKLVVEGVTAQMYLSRNDADHQGALSER